MASGNRMAEIGHGWREKMFIFRVLTNAIQTCRWSPLIGPNRCFDTNRLFIFCANVLGSPYGTASPVTTNSATGRIWGPEFPATSIRDDVRYICFDPACERDSKLSQHVGSMLPS